MTEFCIFFEKDCSHFKKTGFSLYFMLVTDKIKRDTQYGRNLKICVSILIRRACASQRIIIWSMSTVVWKRLRIWLTAESTLLLAGHANLEKRRLFASWLKDFQKNTSHFSSALREWKRMFTRHPLPSANDSAVFYTVFYDIMNA